MFFFYLCVLNVLGLWPNRLRRVVTIRGGFSDAVILSTGCIWTKFIQKFNIYTSHNWSSCQNTTINSGLHPYFHLLLHQNFVIKSAAICKAWIHQASALPPHGHKIRLRIEKWITLFGNLSMEKRSQNSRN